MDTIRKRHHPKVWAERLKLFPVEYQGWAASIIWFGQSVMDGARSPDPAMKKAWSEFHHMYVPLNIPSDLDQNKIRALFRDLLNINLNERSDDQRGRVKRRAEKKALEQCK